MASAQLAFDAGEVDLGHAPSSHGGHAGLGTPH
jgi:hypothetical protein